MSSPEIPVTITPQQAAHGVILTVPLPGRAGTARLRIPSSTPDGALVRARLGDAEVLLRVRVAPDGGAGAGPGQAGQPGAAGARGCLIAVGVAVALVAGLALLNSGDDGDGTASGSPRPTPSYSPWSSAPALPPADTPGGSATDPVASPAEAAPSPFDRGTCLNGTLPDSTTARTVTGVREVPCSAPDAHYRVIQSIPMTSELDRCNDNPKTQYAFSYRYTRNGIPINEYVYCLVGIGSYAR